MPTHRIGKTGDVLLCSGKGNFASYIKFFTRSPYSHLAWLVEFELLGEKILMVAESTMSQHIPDYISIKEGKPEIIKGVQYHTYDKWLDAYQGEVWWCELYDPLTEEEKKILIDWVTEARAKRVPYDLLQAMGAGFDILDYFFSNDPDFNKLFCFEFWVRAMQIIKRLGLEVNPSEAKGGDILKYDLLYAPERLK